MKNFKVLMAAFILIFFVGVSSLYAQTDAWYDGGSLVNVDLCDHNGPEDFGFEYLYWDLNNVRAVYSAYGMTGPVKAIEKQLAKLESWLGTHGDGIINFDVTNQSKVDNVMMALMEIGAEIYWEGQDLGSNEISEAGLFLYYDAEHCLNYEYWDD